MKGQTETDSPRLVKGEYLYFVDLKNVHLFGHVKILGGWP